MVQPDQNCGGLLLRYAMALQRATALKPPGTPSQTALPKPVEAFTPPNQQGTGLATGVSPGRGATIRTPSSGGRIVNTPEQLKPYLVRCVLQIRSTSTALDHRPLALPLHFEIWRCYQSTSQVHGKVLQNLIVRWGNAALIIKMHICFMELDRKLGHVNATAQAGC